MDRPTLLRNCRICSASSCDDVADVLVRGGRIEAVAADIHAPQAQAVDLAGLTLAPGFVDLHTHLREPGFTEKETIETGTRAAAAGGYTTVCAMPNVHPVPDSRARLEAQRALFARGRIEVLAYGAITEGERGEALCDLAGMAGACVGFSDDGKGVQRDALMAEAMRRVAAWDGWIAAHCEDERLLVPGACVHAGHAAQAFGLAGIPGACEWRQVERDLALVAQTGARYHVCHISSARTVALLREAKRQGLPVTGECTPHQLALCEDDITEDDGRFKMNPPLRARADRDAIIEGLLDGTIDCIATDHAPHTAEEKSRGLSGSAFGVVGLETAFAACYTALVASGRCTLAFLMEKMATAPAAILGRTARIAPGEAASLVALDTSARWTVEPAQFFSKGRSTPFAGRTLTGQVVATWHRGKKIYDRRHAHAPFGQAADL